MRWIFRILGAIGAIIGVVVVALFVIPTDRIAKIAADQMTVMTGRALTIEGDVHPTLYPVLGITMQDVTLANAGWASKAPLVRADTVAVGIRLAPLFSGAVQIADVSVIGARILLERGADGTGNWVVSGTADPVSTTNTSDTDSLAVGLPATFSLDHAVVKNAHITWRDAVNGQTIALADIDLKVAMPSPVGETHLVGGLTYRDERITWEGRIQDIAGLLSGAVQPVELAVTAAGAHVDLDGRVGISPIAADITLGVDVPNVAPLMGLAEINAPIFPGNMGRDIGINGHLIYTTEGHGALYLRDATARLAANTLHLEADLTLPQSSNLPSNLAAKIVAKDLDLSTLTTGTARSGPAESRSAVLEPAVSGTGWPRARLDVSALGTLNGTVALTAESVDLGRVKLDAIDTVFTLEDRRLVVGLNQIAVYDGELSGQAVVNGRDGLSIGGDLQMSRIALRPLLTDLAAQDRLIGTANGALRYLAVGDSVHDLMQTLSGTGRIAIGQGEILGLDLAGMLRNFDAYYRGEGSKTVFDAVTASVEVENGLATNTDLNLDGPLFTATGAGTVDIGAQTLQYRVTPVALTGGAEIAVPVIVEGPWNDLGFRPDLKGLIDQNLAAERAAVEAAMRTQAEEALKRELGVDVEAAEGNVEDAVRERIDQQADVLRKQVEEQLRNEVGNALRGLFGGN